MTISIKWLFGCVFAQWEHVALARVFDVLSFDEEPDTSSPEASACPYNSDGGCGLSPSTPRMAMIQKQFKTQLSRDPDVNNKLFRWGVSESKEHPKTIGKHMPHAQIQQYEAKLPYLTSVVLNIFSKVSNGDGGLLLAMEVPAPCGEKDSWIEVDRSRCSKKYPCSLRLPAGAVRGSESQPTKFRTRVIVEDDDYLTEFLAYERVSLDPDAEVELVREHFSDARIGDKQKLKKVVQFNLSPVLSAGALTVTPVIEGATDETMITMRIRQEDPSGGKEILSQTNRKLLNKTKTKVRQHPKTSLQQHESDTMLEATLNSYRAHWAADWRSSNSAIPGCEYSNFEVVSDQLYPGNVELEVWVAGGAETKLTDLVVSTRVSWSEAEVTLLDTILKDHFAFFNDPDEMVHGLPLDALKKQDPGLLTDSNPTEWGYAMQSWLVMAETGVLTDKEVADKLRESITTIETLQKDSSQFAHGLFFPFYRLRVAGAGDKQFPQATDLKELPCGDVALFYASLMMVQGWLKEKEYTPDADRCSQILEQIHFKNCVRITDCGEAGNGLEGGTQDSQSDKFWSIALTFNADTLEQNTFNWNVWADEGGIVAMIVALDGAVNDTQYESIVRQQQRYSPCSHWDGVTVGHSAFFNSIFTLPTRSILGFGTLFSSPYYHEFAVRSVLPSFRAHQKLKHRLGVDYIGPSDAMTSVPRGHQGVHFGSYAYWPPNNMYDCRKGKITLENQCTWCKGKQMEGYEDVFTDTVPHGNMAAFLVASMMEKSQFSSWIEDTKRLITDWSDIYKPGYGFEVLGPANRTVRGERYVGGNDGRGIWESLSHGYIILSMYEGLATMRRRYELVKQEGFEIPGTYQPPAYRPLSDILNNLPKVRARINHFLAITKEQESQEKKCGPSVFGPPGRY
jgi:hypothetical protein